MSHNYDISITYELASLKSGLGTAVDKEDVPIFLGDVGHKVPLSRPGCLRTAEGMVVWPAVVTVGWWFRQKTIAKFARLRLRLKDTVVCSITCFPDRFATLWYPINEIQGYSQDVNTHGQSRAFVLVYDK